MNSQENNQAPTPAQNQHHDATGEQPDGTFGQREDPSHGGFASSQQDMSEVSSQGEAGIGQHMGGQNSANNAGQAGYAGQQQQGATGGMDAGYDSGRPTSGGQQQQGSGQSALGSQSNIGASGSSQAGLSSIGQAGSGQSGQSGLGQSGSGMSASGQAGYNAGQQSQFDAGDSGQFRDQLREQMEVVDANGEHCGTIDSIDGDRIKLTRSDSTDGQHHYVEMSQVAGIESGQVRLNSNSQTGDADSNAPDNWNG